MAIYLDDKSGVRFYSDGRAVIDGTTVNVGKPQKVFAKGYTVDAFLSDAPERRNSEYNRIGYCLVPKLGGGEVLYPLLEKINATKEDLYSKTYSPNSGIKLQSYYFVRSKNGNICAIQGKSDNNSVIATQSGERVPVKDYYFYFNGKAESIKNRGTWFSTWKLKPIEETTQSEQPGNGEKTIDGGQLSPGVNAKGEASERIKALQRALNAAGYTDNGGKQLVDDGITGPKTKAVCKKAGVDYRTWKVGDPIRPASQTQTSPTGTTKTQTTAAPSGTTQTQTTQQTVDYSQSPAYARYLGGANQQEIRKFQYNVGLEPTGVFDQQTAYKAYELATSEDANNQNAVDFKEAGSTIKGYSTYDFRKAAADKATADVTAKYEKQNSEREMQGYTDASNQSLASLNAALDTYLKRSGLAKDKIAYIKNNIARGDFEDAKLFAGQLRMKGAKEIQQLITQYEAAYNKQKAYAAQMQGAQQGAGQQQGQTNQSAAQTANTNGQMNESALVNMLTDMVLNEGKKKPNKAVMNESKLVDMIAESMIKNGVIAL